MRNFFSRLKYNYLIYPILYFFRLFSKKSKKIESPHFFILGSGRNGSTLLASMLNTHKDILIPPEQYILPYAIMRKYLLFFWSTKKWLNNIKSLFNQKDKTTKWRIDLSHINVETKNISELFEKIYNFYQKKNKPQSTIWGDKTPLNTNFIKYIYPEFKSAKYIFLVRDPRDVSVSYKKYLGSSFFSFGVWKWKESIRSFKYLSSMTDVLIVKYEDLVKNPIDELNKIFSFLNLSPYQYSELQKISSEEMGVENEAHHQNLKKSISTDSIGLWKEKLSDTEKKIFSGKIKIIMNEFGYL